MLGDSVGLVTLCREPQFTRYLFGDIHDVAGGTFNAMERNPQGDCMAITSKGLIDIDHRDIDAFIALQSKDPLQQAFDMLEELMGGVKTHTGKEAP